MSEEVETFLDCYNPSFTPELSQEDLGFEKIDDLDINQNVPPISSVIDTAAECEGTDIKDLFHTNEISVETFAVEVVVASSRRRRGRPALLLTSEERRKRTREINRKAAKKYRENKSLSEADKCLKGLISENEKLKSKQQLLLKQIKSLKKL